MSPPPQVSQPRRHGSATEKAKLVRQPLRGGIPLAMLADADSTAPSMIHAWIRVLPEGADQVLPDTWEWDGQRATKPLAAKDDRIRRLIEMAATSSMEVLQSNGVTAQAVTKPNRRHRRPIRNADRTAQPWVRRLQTLAGGSAGGAFLGAIAPKRPRRAKPGAPRKRGFRRRRKGPGQIPNGKIRRWLRGIKTECVRRTGLGDREEAHAVVAHCVLAYNPVGLHGVTGYPTTTDALRRPAHSATRLAQRRDGRSSPRRWCAYAFNHPRPDAA